MNTLQNIEPYAYLVNFEKFFVNGPWEGKRYHDSLRFTDIESAQKFMSKEGSVIGACVGNGDYKLEDCILVDLSKFN